MLRSPYLIAASATIFAVFSASSVLIPRFSFVFWFSWIFASIESDGTIRTFGLAAQVQKILERDAFLAVDEIESSLHPKLIEYIIERFLKESEQAQLLLTTHYDGLLGEEDLLRKDNVWFTEKNLDGSSVLYPLTDFKGLNRISSLQKAYKFGKFGAVPNL